MAKITFAAHVGALLLLVVCGLCCVADAKTGDLHMKYNVSQDVKYAVMIDNPDQVNSFGKMLVHNYPIYNGSGHIVGRFNGLQVTTQVEYSPIYFGRMAIFTLSLPDGDLSVQGSSHNKVTRKYAVVGGTHKYLFAKGHVTLQKMYATDGHPLEFSDISELHIYLRYQP